MDLVGMNIRAQRSEIEFTVLTREGKPWSDQEAANLVVGLTTELQRLPAKPCSLIMFGKFPLENITLILGAEEKFTHQILVGYDNPNLPFRPIF